MKIISKETLEEEESMLHSTWKAIAKRLGNIHIDTAKKIVKDYDMPIVYMNGHPTIEEWAFREWWSSLKEHPKNIKIS
jgi:hypothetical protein